MRKRPRHKNSLCRSHNPDWRGQIKEVRGGLRVTPQGSAAPVDTNHVFQTHTPLLNGPWLFYTEGVDPGGWDHDFYVVSEEWPDGGDKSTRTNHFAVARTGLWGDPAWTGFPLDDTVRFAWQELVDPSVFVYQGDSNLIGMGLWAGNHPGGRAGLELLGGGEFRVGQWWGYWDITNGQSRVLSAPADGVDGLFVQCLSAGEATLRMTYTNANVAGVSYTSEIKIQGRRLFILADTDRDGKIDALDEPGKDCWDEARGAIYAVNYNRYDGFTLGHGPGIGHLPAPNVIHFGDSGQALHEGYEVINADHAANLTPLHIRVPALPPGGRAFVRVGIQAQGRDFHMCKRIAPGEKAVFGTWSYAFPNRPPISDRVDITDWANPASTNFVGDRATGVCKFGIEGLGFANHGLGVAAMHTFDGCLEFHLEVRNILDQVVYQDSIRLTVAPLILISPDQPSMEVWAAEWGNWNLPFLYNAHATPPYKGLDNAGPQQFRTAPWNASPSHTAWFQDHVKIGYTQRPGGPLNHIVFRLPYDRRKSRLDPIIPQPTWPLEYMLTNNVGVFQLGVDLESTHHGADYGGNIEVLSPNAQYPYGRIVLGDSQAVSDGLTSFFDSQKVQFPIVNAPVEYLRVSHIDEITSFQPGGEVIVADPAMGIQLLEAIDATNRASSVFFAMGRKPVTGVLKSYSWYPTKYPLIELETAHTNKSWKYLRVYEANTPGTNEGLVLGIEHHTGNFYWVVYPWQTTASNYLTHAHESSAFLYTWPTLQAGDKYVLCEDTKFWLGTGNPAVITVKELLADTTFTNVNAIMKTKIDAAINAIHTNHSGLAFASIPGLFLGALTNNNDIAIHSACAFNPGAANLQLVGNTLYIPRQYAPLNGASQDIFEMEIKSVLSRNIEFVDDWMYHSGMGEIHCGSTVKRTPPDEWWLDLPKLKEEQP
jgi:hypothetical protein